MEDMSGWAQQGRWPLTRNQALVVATLTCLLVGGLLWLLPDWSVGERLLVTAEMGVFFAVSLPLLPKPGARGVGVPTGHGRLVPVGSERGVEIPVAVAGWRRPMSYLMLVVWTGTFTWIEVAHSGSPPVLPEMMACGGALGFVQFGLRWLFPPVLVLTPTELVIGSQRRRVHAAWDTVSRIERISRGASMWVVPLRPAIRVNVPRPGDWWDSSGPHVVEVSMLDADPAAVFTWLRYYYTHPEHRDELRTDTALQRLESLTPPSAQDKA